MVAMAAAPLGEGSQHVPTVQRFMSSVWRLRDATGAQDHPHASPRTGGPTRGHSGHAAARPSQWPSEQRNPDACDSAKCSVSLSMDFTKCIMILPNASKCGENNGKTGKRDRDSLVMLLLKPATAPRKGTGIETALGRHHCPVAKCYKNIIKNVNNIENRKHPKTTYPASAVKDPLYPLASSGRGWQCAGAKGSLKWTSNPWS